MASLKPAAAPPASGTGRVCAEVATDAAVVSDYQLEAQIGFLLRRAHQFATSVFSTSMPEVNLTPPQFSLLVKLAELGQVSQNQLGRLVDIDQSTVQGIVSRLHQRGLLLRSEDPLHKSRLLWQLSAAGAETLARCLPAAAVVTEQTLAALSVAEQRELVRLLKKMVKT